MTPGMKPDNMKQRVTIVHIDPATRTVHAQLRDGVGISVAVWDLPPVFRWPRVGEVWSVYYRNGYPMLGERIHENTQIFKIEDIDEGEMYLDATIIKDASGTTISPIGHIVLWATSTAPDGWLFCNGSSVSRTTYANLFAIIGTTFGVGDGSTTFELPTMADPFTDIHYIVRT